MLSILIIIVTGIITYVGLEKVYFRDRYLFWVEGILQRKEYDRLLSSGFLHNDWMHFALNMYLLFILGPSMEKVLGLAGFLFLYLFSIFTGNLLSLYENRHKAYYRGLGASGGVFGLLFAFILMQPNAKFYFFFIIEMRAWVLALLYLAYSIYGMETKRDNIGHDAHLGGAIGGLAVIAALQPFMIMLNWIYALAFVVPIVVYLIYKWGNFQYRLPFKSKPKGYKTIDDRFNEEKKSKEEELNALLEKVNKVGYEKLSEQEKKRLDELSL